MRLEARALACRRAGRLVFAGVDFTLASGGALSVEGRNGAGKSSLLAMLCERLQPANGRLSLEGAGEEPLSGFVNFVGHREGLKSTLTAGENLAFAAAMLGQMRLSLRESLARLDVEHLEDVPVARLSAGQKRRVALARLALSARPLWVLDEPMTALDADSRDLLRGLMNEHLGQGGMIVAATHAPLELRNTVSLHIEPPEGGAILESEAVW